MTTSYLRIADLASRDPDMPAIRAGFDALLRLYARANAEAPVSANALKAYRKIGFVNAFFFADRFRASSESATEDKWVDILARIRDATTSAGMVSALKTKGAQNLNITKVTQVLDQVDAYLAGILEPALADSDEYSEDEADA
jgi:hypothetical protein